MNFEILIFQVIYKFLWFLKCDRKKATKNIVCDKG